TREGFVRRACQELQPSDLGQSAKRDGGRPPRCCRSPTRQPGAAWPSREIIARTHRRRAGSATYRRPRRDGGGGKERNLTGPWILAPQPPHFNLLRCQFA